MTSIYFHSFIFSREINPGLRAVSQNFLSYRIFKIMCEPRKPSWLKGLRKCHQESLFKKREGKWMNHSSMKMSSPLHTKKNEGEHQSAEKED